MRTQVADSFFEFDGARLRYRDEGRGPAAIFIHGWTLDLDMWNGQVLALSSAFRVIRLDRRGFGLSSGRPSLAHDVADLQALRRYLGLDQIALVGMSQGARVALEFARAAPAAISCLVLDGPPGMRAGSPDVPYEHYRALARTRGLEAFRREWAEHPLAILKSHDPAARKLLAAMVARYPGTDLLQEPGIAVPPGEPAGINGPALVIGGEYDVESRKSAADELATLLPHGQRAVIPDAGHLCNLDNPVAYNMVVGRFLARHARK